MYRTTYTHTEIRNIVPSDLVPQRECSLNKGVLSTFTLLELQSRLGDKPLKFYVLRPQNGAAVPKDSGGVACIILRLGRYSGRGADRELVAAVARAFEPLREPFAGLAGLQMEEVTRARLEPHDNVFPFSKN